MERKNETVDPLKGMTKEQRAELLARLQTEAKNDRMAKRESYEALRGQFMHDVLGRVENLESEVSGFKKWLKFNKVKGFDERADLAAERLVDYLKRYMEASEKGVEDPMYQMAMTLLERNKTGDLDYKSISKLYELEDRFDEEYAEIMRLFKEANVVQATATNYYFSKRNPENGVWSRIEPSFCRL